MFNPSPPGAGTWWTPTGGYTPQPSYAGSPYGSQPYGSQAASPSASASSTRPRFYNTAGGPVTLPADWPEEDAQQWVQAYDQYIGRLTQQWQAASGLQRRQIEAQIEDAKQARKNQMEIAQLQDRTSRYGIDVGSRDRMRQLQEEARQFDARHGLEMERLGLDRQRVGLEYANTATDYLSTPDRYMEGATYLNLAGRVFAGQPGAARYGSVGTPTPKTEQDFANLAAGGSGQQMPASTSPSDVAARAASAGGAGSDARIKALRAVIEAAPPSPDPGLNHNDQAVLAAARALYSTNLQPGQFQALQSDPTSRGVNRSTGRRLGYDVESWEAQQRRNYLSQGSSRAA